MMESIQIYGPGEESEYQYLYQMLADYAEDHNSPLAEQADTGAAMAERVHAALLGQASDMENFTEEKIYVWPVCGGPKQQYEVFAAD